MVSLLVGAAVAQGQQQRSPSTQPQPTLLPEVQASPPPEYAQLAQKLAEADWNDEAVADFVKSLSDEEAGKLINLSEALKAQAKRSLTTRQRIERALLNPWVLFGLVAQVAFMMRFVVQLIASERKKRSYVPVAFWYLSLIGGSMLLVYALKLRDPVFVLGQSLGCVIYLRNLVLIRRRNDTYNDRMAQRQTRNGGGSPVEGNDLS